LGAFGYLPQNLGVLHHESAFASSKRQKAKGGKSTQNPYPNYPKGNPNWAILPKITQLPIPKRQPNWVFRRQIWGKLPQNPYPNIPQNFAFCENSQKVLGGEKDAKKIAGEVGVKGFCGLSLSLA